MADSLPFRLTNRVANPLLLRLLRTRAGRLLGRRLAVLRYTGTRTGEPHEPVTMYVRTGDTAWVFVGQPQLKGWWRNLRTPAASPCGSPGRRSAPEPLRSRARASQSRHGRV